MIEYPIKSDKVENELFEISAELTALGDMIPCLFMNIDDIEIKPLQNIRFYKGLYSLPYSQR